MNKYFYTLKHEGIIKTAERVSYQPNISDCTQTAQLLSYHYLDFVSPRSQPAKSCD